MITWTGAHACEWSAADVSCFSSSANPEVGEVQGQEAQRQTAEDTGQQHQQDADAEVLEELGRTGLEPAPLGRALQDIRLRERHGTENRTERPLAKERKWRLWPPPPPSFSFSPFLLAAFFV
jgi:hypothetical protein